MRAVPAGVVGAVGRPDPDCPICHGDGYRRVYEVRTVDANMPGGQSEYVPCSCTTDHQGGSGLPSGGIWAVGKLALFMTFVGVPVVLLVLAQTDWADDLFSTSPTERLAQIQDSQTIWIGEVECSDGPRPLLVESKMVPALGESLQFLVLRPAADMTETLDQTLTNAEERQANLAGEAAELGGLALPADLPRRSLASAVTLWGGGDEGSGSYQRRGTTKVTGAHRLAPRRAEVRFDADEGTIFGELTAARCKSFTGNQP